MKNLFLVCFNMLFLFGCTKKEVSIVNSTSLADYNYEKADEFLMANQIDSSFVYFDMASDQYLDNKDSLLAANCLIRMAITLFYQGDYYGAQETSLEANLLLDTLNQSHYAYLAPNYNNLANSIAAVGEADVAIPYYDLAIRFAPDTLDAKVYINNKAVTLFDAKRLNEAFDIYQKNLHSFVLRNTDYARALSNYANLRWRIDDHYDALPDLKKALRIREMKDENWGKNSSYAHLYAYFKSQNNIDSALYYAKKSYGMAKQLNSSDDILKSIDRLIQVNTADSAKYYFSIYKNLEDSIQTSRLKASNQFALIRYDVEKNKLENIKLQSDIIQKELRFSKLRITLGAIVVILMIVGAWLFHWNKRRKYRLELEADNKIRENQLKTSRKIHDVVANGIYRVMSEIEYTAILDRDKLLDSLENMYEKSRDISYEAQSENKLPDFSKSIADMLKSFANNTVKVLIVGNNEELWSNISANNQNEILLICQELMVNMSKHSVANEVIIVFEIVDSELKITYSDNGVGLSSLKNQGNGFQNTGNRMEKLGGTIIFDSENGKGLKIFLTVPYS